MLQQTNMKIEYNNIKAFNNIFSENNDIIHIGPEIIFQSSLMHVIALK